MRGARPSLPLSTAATLGPGGEGPASSGSQGIMAKVKDPICGMMIDPARAAGKSEHDGVVTYFCSLGCKAKFDAAHAH